MALGYIQLRYIQCGAQCVYVGGMIHYYYKYASEQECGRECGIEQYQESRQIVNENASSNTRNVGNYARWLE